MERASPDTESRARGRVSEIATLRATRCPPFWTMIPVVLVLGILGYAGVGTLIASMSAYAKGREILLPILLLPIALSLLIPAVQATLGLLQDVPINELATWFNMLIATNVIYITLAYMLFDFVVEE